MEKVIEPFDEGAMALLRTNATKARFEEVTKLPELKGASLLPADTKLFDSAYAQLMVMTANSGRIDELRRLIEIGQSWIDLRCEQLEEDSRATVDGYLLILIRDQPDVDAISYIRATEVDPVACRKHFAWPIEGAEDSDLKWSRIFRVTCLGIPDSPALTGMAESPPLDSELQIQILDDIKTHKNGADAAAHHVSLIEGWGAQNDKD